MRNDDQWFEPGDKVMRVAYANALRLPHASTAYLVPESDFGKVLCVQYCEHIPGLGNFVKFAGIALDRNGFGFYARCFRKVEEIKLCVKAVQRVKEPIEANTSVQITAPMPDTQ